METNCIIILLIDFAHFISSIFIKHRNRNFKSVMLLFTTGHGVLDRYSNWPYFLLVTKSTFHTEKSWSHRLTNSKESSIATPSYLASLKLVKGRAWLRQRHMRQLPWACKSNRKFSFTFLFLKQNISTV